MKKTENLTVRIRVLNVNVKSYSTLQKQNCSWQMG